MTISTLKMCFWNVGGLKSRGNDKTSDPLFIKSIERYDLAFLAETHLGHDSQVTTIGSFLYHPVCRAVTKSNNRYFGGIAILRKPSLKTHVKILKNTNPDYQWIKLEKDFFGFQKDFFICVVYYPPSPSSYTKKLENDILDGIEKDLSSYSKLGDVLICGDLNARVGTLPDYIAQDDHKFLPLFNTYPIDKNVMYRMSKDSKVDKRGKELLDFCKGYQLRILNGRTLGDMQGNFTCYTPNGTSVVDYAVVSESALKSILCFSVSDFIPTLSDCHCRLDWELSANYIVNNKNTNSGNVHPMPLRYMWSDDSGSLFQEAMVSDLIQSQINDLLNNTTLDSTSDINIASVKLANIFTQAADMSLKKQKKNNNYNKKNP